MDFHDKEYEKYLIRLFEKEAAEKEKEALENLGSVGGLLTSHSPRRKEASGVFSVHAYGDLIKVTLFKKPCGKRPAAPPEGVESKTNEPDVGATGARMANNLSRARARVFELAMCNEFSFFCTFTLNEKKRDRYDLPGFRKALAMMIRNINRERPEWGKIKYLMIPEKHKNGAYHMHGLFLGFTSDDLRAFTLSERLPKAIRDNLEAGETVWNWERYAEAFGFFTATEIHNRTATAKYITKYITKELGAAVEEEGGHLFYASQGLAGRETVLWRETWDYAFSDEDWDFENEYVRVRWIDPEKIS